MWRSAWLAGRSSWGFAVSAAALSNFGQSFPFLSVHVELVSVRIQHFSQHLQHFEQQLLLRHHVLQLYLRPSSSFYAFFQRKPVRTIFLLGRHPCISKAEFSNFVFWLRSSALSKKIPFSWVTFMNEVGCALTGVDCFLDRLIIIRYPERDLLPILLNRKLNHVPSSTSEVFSAATH